MIETAYFLMLAVLAVVAAIAVIASRNTVHSALFLVMNLFCVAMLYLSLAAEFLAVLQITVYAGAIMVLFLFVITLLNPGREEGPNRILNRLPLALGCALAFLVIVSLVLQPGVLNAAAAGPQHALSANATNLENIGAMLFTGYLLPFELASVLLLVAMVAAIVLAKQRG